MPSPPAMTLTVIVLGVGSRSTPPLAVPPLSCTWNVKLAYPAPFAFAAGVNESLPATISATDTTRPGTIDVPANANLPAAGMGANFTESNEIDGVASPSLD